MSRTTRVRVLIDNTARGQGIMAEHGLTFWVDTGCFRLLFDTGQGLSSVLRNNARKLETRLDKTDAIVLSHGRCDHTGGLADVLAAADRPMLYAHPAAFESKYVRADDGAARYIGVSSRNRRAVEQHVDEVCCTDQPREVHNGLAVTGPVPRVTDFEDTGGPFFLDADLRQPDPLFDDQALFFQIAEETCKGQGRNGGEMWHSAWARL